MPTKKPSGNKPEETVKSESKSSSATSKMPDLSSIASKFDLDKILNSIKSMINPEEGAEPGMKADPSDALGIKITELSALLQEVSKTHAKLSKDFSKANDLLVGLFKDLEAVRAKSSSKK